MHDGMPYDAIRGQGQGDESVKVRNSSIFRSTPNNMGDKMSVRPYVCTSVRTSVRPQKVFPISMKFGVYIEVDE